MHRLNLKKNGLGIIIGIIIVCFILILSIYYLFFNNFLNGYSGTIDNISTNFEPISIEEAIQFKYECGFSSNETQSLSNALIQSKADTFYKFTGTFNLKGTKIVGTLKAIILINTMEQTIKMVDFMVTSIETNSIWQWKEIDSQYTISYDEKSVRLSVVGHFKRQILNKYNTSDTIRPVFTVNII